MTAKEFLESKGYDEVPEGISHVFYQHEIESLLNEFAALPCSCEGGHYGYGAAKCFVCGRVKEVEKGGHFTAVSGSFSTDSSIPALKLNQTVGELKLDKNQMKVRARIYINTWSLEDD